MARRRDDDEDDRPARRRGRDREDDEEEGEDDGPEVPERPREPLWPKLTRAVWMIAMAVIVIHVALLAIGMYMSKGDAQMAAVCTIFGTPMVAALAFAYCFEKVGPHK